MSNTQMDNIKFPKYIYAIGGTGKELIYKIFEKKWLIREILRPKRDPTIVDITIIDTALDEEDEDWQKIQIIEKIRDEISNEYALDLSDANKKIGKIDIKYRLITKEMVLQSPYDLIGIKDQVKQATKASIWWLNDEQLGEDWHKRVINRENFRELNFNRGVYRKRAIGKAIYYKALSEGQFEFDLPEAAKVDIIAGLGGGTGSGIAFDLAEKLKSIQPNSDITFFGILSTLNEKEDEKANSFAMMNELEYASLKRISPFKDVILIPMEATRFPGKEKASEEHKLLLSEFDETFIYILISYHNNPSERLFDKPPDFAPFIIATPQIVSYIGISE